VILYADKETSAIRNTVRITKERREIQKIYNEEHGIIPRSAKRADISSLDETFGFAEISKEEIPSKKEKLEITDLEKKIKECETEMRKAAKELRFEDAARARDLMRYYQNLEMLKT
jgi:excinuclease ABC subunit B